MFEPVRNRAPLEVALLGDAEPLQCVDHGLVVGAGQRLPELGFGPGVVEPLDTMTVLVG